MEGVKKEENDDEDSSEENRVLAQDEPKVQTPKKKYVDYDRKRGEMLSSWISSMDQLQSTSDDLLGKMKMELGRDCTSRADEDQAECSIVTDIRSQRRFGTCVGLRARRLTLVYFQFQGGPGCSKCSFHTQCYTRTFGGLWALS